MASANVNSSDWKTCLFDPIIVNSGPSFRLCIMVRTLLPG